VTLVVPPRSSSASTNLGLGVLFLVLLGGACLLMWRFSRGDRAFREDVLEKRRYGEQVVDLNAVLHDQPTTPQRPDRPPGE
jgi:hypothetical protein